MEESKNENSRGIEEMKHGDDSLQGWILSNSNDCAESLHSNLVAASDCYDNFPEHDKSMVTCEDFKFCEGTASPESSEHCIEETQISAIPKLHNKSEKTSKIVIIIDGQDEDDHDVVPAVVEQSTFERMVVSVELESDDGNKVQLNKWEPYKEGRKATSGNGSLERLLNSTILNDNFSSSDDLVVLEGWQILPSMNCSASDKLCEENVLPEGSCVVGVDSCSTNEECGSENGNEATKIQNGKSPDFEQHVSIDSKSHSGVTTHAKTCKATDADSSVSDESKQNQTISVMGESGDPMTCCELIDNTTSETLFKQSGDIKTVFTKEPNEIKSTESQTVSVESPNHLSRPVVMLTPGRSCTAKVLPTNSETPANVGPMEAENPKEIAVIEENWTVADYDSVASVMSASSEVNYDEQGIPVIMENPQDHVNPLFLSPAINPLDPICFKCGQHFSDFSTLGKHLKNHNQKDCYSPYIYECDICHKVFPYEKSCRNHRQRHFPPHNFSCDICQENFHRKTFLDLHIARKHAKDKPFVCEVCTRPFALLQDLKRHIKAHEAAKKQRARRAIKNKLEKLGVLGEKGADLEDPLKYEQLGLINAVSSSSQEFSKPD